MEAVRTSETSVDNHFTRQYIPEDNSELLLQRFYQNNFIIIITLASTVSPHLTHRY
jgi:hypothetical protein